MVQILVSSIQMQTKRGGVVLTSVELRIERQCIPFRMLGKMWYCWMMAWMMSYWAVSELQLYQSGSATTVYHECLLHWIYRDLHPLHSNCSYANQSLLFHHNYCCYKSHLVHDYCRVLELMDFELCFVIDGLPQMNPPLHSLPQLFVGGCVGALNLVLMSPHY